MADRGASYSGVFTLLPLLTGRGRAHHGAILAAATALAEAGRLRPQVDILAASPWARPRKRTRPWLRVRRAGSW